MVSHFKSKKIISGKNFNQHINIFPSDQLCYIIDSSFIALQSQKGGAISSEFFLSISRCKFIICTSSSIGGGIYSLAPINISHSSFSSCSSKQASAIFSSFNNESYSNYNQLNSKTDLILKYEASLYSILFEKCSPKQDNTLEITKSRLLYHSCNITFSNAQQFSALLADSCNSTCLFSIFSNSSASICSGIYFFSDSIKFLVDRCIFVLLKRYTYPGFGGVAIYIENNPYDSIICECLFINLSYQQRPSCWVCKGEVLRIISCCSSGLKAEEILYQTEFQQQIGCFYSALCDFDWSYQETIQGWMQNHMKVFHYHRSILFFIGIFFLIYFSFLIVIFLRSFTEPNPFKNQ